MITNEGKLHIKRYMAGYVPAIAQSMAFGIGTTAEAAGDSRLELEVDSAFINLSYFDFVNNQLVYKADLPYDFEGQVRELGVYSLPENPASADFASRLITTFDSATEDWVTSGDVLATFTPGNTRVGPDSLQLTPAASTTLTYFLNDIELDLSGHSAADQFVFAYYVSNANSSVIQVRFWTDTTNYYWVNFTSPTVGYKMTPVNKGALTAVGTPDWSTITRISVAVTSTAGGASDISMDAIRINDLDTAAIDYILVARKVLASPIIKVAGMPQSIEFRIDVSTL